MSLFDHIERILEKPRRERRRIALMYSGGITAVVFIMWLAVIVPRMGGEVVADSSDVSPLGELKDGFSTAFNDVRNSYAQIKGEAEVVTSMAQQAAVYSAALENSRTATATADMQMVATTTSMTTEAETSNEANYDFGY